MLNELITRAIKLGGFMEIDRNYLTNLVRPLITEKNANPAEYTTYGLITELATKNEFIPIICNLITPPPSVINAFFAEHFHHDPKKATEYYFSLLEQIGFFYYLKQNSETFPVTYFLAFSEGDQKLPMRRFIRLNLQHESWGFQALTNHSGIVFPEEQPRQRKKRIWLERMLGVVEIFPHLEAKLNSEYIEVDLIKGPQVIDILEQFEVNAHLLLSLEKLSNHKLRLTGYNSEEIAQFGEQIEPYATEMIAIHFGNQIALEFSFNNNNDLEKIIAKLKS